VPASSSKFILRYALRATQDIGNPIVLSRRYEAPPYRRGALALFRMSAKRFQISYGTSAFGV